MLGPLSFGVDAGECLCISGPSGTGKSVTLRHVIGEFSDGDPRYFNSSLAKKPYRSW